MGDCIRSYMQCIVTSFTSRKKVGMSVNAPQGCFLGINRSAPSRKSTEKLVHGALMAIKTNMFYQEPEQQLTSVSPAVEKGYLTQNPLTIPGTHFCLPSALFNIYNNVQLGVTALRLNESIRPALRCQARTCKSSVTQMADHITSKDWRVTLRPLKQSVGWRHKIEH